MTRQLFDKVAKGRGGNNYNFRLVPVTHELLAWQLRLFACAKSGVEHLRSKDRVSMHHAQHAQLVLAAWANIGQSRRSETKRASWRMMSQLGW